MKNPEEPQSPDEQEARSIDESEDEGTPEGEEGEQDFAEKRGTDDNEDLGPAEESPDNGNTTLEIDNVPQLPQTELNDKESTGEEAGDSQVDETIHAETTTGQNDVAENTMAPPLVASDTSEVPVADQSAPQDQQTDEGVGSTPEPTEVDEESSISTAAVAAEPFVSEPQPEPSATVESTDVEEVEHIDDDSLLIEIVPETVTVTGMLREIADFTANFDQATYENALSVSASRNDASGGVRRPAILQHPQGHEESRLSYFVILPEIAQGERLVLCFGIGLRDGIPSDDTSRDGVRFRLEIDDELVFSGSTRECRWEDHLLDVTRLAGREAHFVWITDAGEAGNTSYDWALWGEPRILMLSHVSDGLAGRFTQGWILGQPDEDESLLGGFEFDEPDGKSIEELADMGRQRLSDQWSQPVSAIAVFSYEPQLQLLGLGPATAVVPTGNDFVLRCAVQNIGRVPVAPPQKASVTLEGVRLSRDRAEKDIRVLAPGEEAQLQWRVRSFSREREVSVTAKLKHTFGDATDSQSLRTNFSIERVAPKLAGRADKELTASLETDHFLLQNEHVRAVFVQGQRGIGYVQFFAARSGNYHQIGVTSPIASLGYLDASGEPVEIAFRPAIGKLMGSNANDGSLLFEETHIDSQGAKWHFQSIFTLKVGAKHIDVDYRLSVDTPRQLLYFYGPSLHAGDGAFGEHKTFALFPGLEYLEGDEMSSSTRDAEPPLSLRVVPHPAKITLPLMAVEHESMLAGILWDPLQQWDLQNRGVAAQFASPNWYEHQENHLMRLFVPTVPGWVTENTSVAREPYSMAANQPVSIRAAILLDGSAHILDSMQHWVKLYGEPVPLRAPRNDELEIELSRHAFMHTVWDADKEASRHCVGWASANVPGFAVLLWRDHLITGDPSARERAERITQKILQDAGEKGLVSPVNCHILRWELPFYCGHLRGAFEGAREQVASIMAQQQGDGSWRFKPTDERTRSLGEDGDAVLGTCARNAWCLLKYARVTGDEAALQAGLRALNFMKQFRVPRGAQAWECPLYEPDILAAAYGVGAYVEAHRILEDRRHLHQAEYWARTGQPFLYHWHYEDRPGMLFGSIPVFGTTFYTHPWFGVPVQWNGLVYAYHIQHLAECLGQDSWRTIARGILVSAMYQQWTEGELKGTYPDGFYEYCTVGKGPHINPENIMVNLLTLRGLDPDIRTQVLRTKRGRVHVSSGAEPSELQFNRGQEFSFLLNSAAGRKSFTLVAGLDTPGHVLIDGQLIEMGAEGDQGWAYDSDSRCLFLELNHPTNDALRIQICQPVSMPIGEEGSKPRESLPEQE